MRCGCRLDSAGRVGCARLRIPLVAPRNRRRPNRSGGRGGTRRRSRAHRASRGYRDPDRYRAGRHARLRHRARAAGPSQRDGRHRRPSGGACSRARPDCAARPWTFGSYEVVLAVYAAVWPVVLSTAAGVAAVHPRQYDVARTLHLSRAATVRTIVVPAAVPAWLAGTRMAAVAALLVAIVAEMIMWPRGLGGGLTESLHALAPARMWAYRVICGFVGFLVNLLLRHGVRRAGPGSTLGRFAGRAAAGGSTARAGATGRRAGGLAARCSRCPVVSAPERVVHRFLAGLHDDGALLPAIGHTVAVVVAGLALATLIGTAVGIAIGASRWVDRALTPSVEFLAAVPAAAFVPIAVLLLGTSMASEVAVVALVTAWPILLEIRRRDAHGSGGAARCLAHTPAFHGRQMAKSRPAHVGAGNSARRPDRGGTRTRRGAARGDPRCRDRYRQIVGRKPARASTPPRPGDCCLSSG